MGQGTVPDSSVGKESTCNAGDPILILGQEDLPGEGQATHSSILRLSLWLSWWESAVRETWAWSLGWEDLQEKGKATHCSILAWRIPWTL